MKKMNIGKEEPPEKTIGDLSPGPSDSKEIYLQQMRLANMESQLEILKEQLTKTEKQLEKTEVLLLEEQSAGNQPQKMKEDYSNWVADPRDVRFDEGWRLVVVIAFLLPITLSCLFFWVILT
jgi:hypothetical protein|tara:strand:- start:72 stop:437 length:366 start_codon:yes stop_codon:yes gene_type:complete